MQSADARAWTRRRPRLPKSLMHHRQTGQVLLWRIGATVNITAEAGPDPRSAIELDHRPVRADAGSGLGSEGRGG
jgi:hypothetical protein